MKYYISKDVYFECINYSYDELMSEFIMVNLRGRELQVCTFYQPPFSYLNRTTKKIINDVEEEVFLIDNGE